ncbi:PD-(D/E)XK nuclease family protein [Capilliphycus salinus ALCB114379]|uniref:PD-(D/E)XK nuclease family protein n=1 Tax=Capilliphycus salinus TaxID=2768948 RepID=UPI0039A46980
MLGRAFGKINFAAEKYTRIVRVEKINSRFRFNCNVPIQITGRYDRLDWLDEGVELIDYKTGKKNPEF